MIPEPEIKFRVDCVPCADPLTSIFNPEIPPLPVQSVLLLLGSSVHPPPVKFRMLSTGRFVPPLCTRAIVPFDPFVPLVPFVPLDPVGPVDPAGPDAGKDHVMRGGSWDSDPKSHLRLSIRRAGKAEGRH